MAKYDKKEKRNQAKANRKKSENDGDGENEGPAIKDSLLFTRRYSLR